MRTIRLENVSKSLGGELILDDVSLAIPTGQFFAILGPSGCGKTTILRLLAGLEAVDSGKIYIGSEDVTNVPVFDRRVNTVFQNYALFPHLSVFENVAYSLRLKDFEEDDVVDKVSSFLKMIGLLGHENKLPATLSGGQKQRVALARALVGEPEVILFDESLSALDPKLKERMLIDLMELQYKLKTTFVYVTHDQTEALTVADNMAIMNLDGSIAQIGAPKEVYEFPVSRFVADFVGNTNLFEGVLHKGDDGLFFLEVERLGNIKVAVSEQMNWMIPGGKAHASVRPEKIEIRKERLSGFSNCLKGVVWSTSYSGRSTQYQIMLDNGQKSIAFERNVEHISHEKIVDDDVVYVHFKEENVVLLEN